MDKATYLQTIQQHLQTSYLLSEDKAASMIPVFASTLKNHVNQLAELADGGDAEQLSRASHTVKGALLNIGLSELAELAFTIEKQCQNGENPMSYQPLIHELQHAVLLFCEDW